MFSYSFVFHVFIVVFFLPMYIHTCRRLFLVMLHVYMYIHICIDGVVPSDPYRGPDTSRCQAAPEFLEP